MPVFSDTFTSWSAFPFKHTSVSSIKHIATIWMNTQPSESEDLDQTSLRTNRLNNVMTLKRTWSNSCNQGVYIISRDIWIETAWIQNL